MTSSCVFMFVQLNKWVVVCGSVLQRGHNNNNNCLKSNIQCIEIRVQWTVHLGSSHMHVYERSLF